MVKFLLTSKNKKVSIKNLIPCSLRRRNMNYQKLPTQLLKLSVLKLDGSSFSFHVARNASVSVLKLAIEEAYSISINDTDTMLWSLVWSHFCLCYGDQKLINDKALLQSCGIKDGDQLQFIQHLRIDHAPDRGNSRQHISSTQIKQVVQLMKIQL